MDEADRASEAEAIYLQAGLARALGARATFGESSTECEDCGKPIPEKRRVAVPGCIRCVKCQNEFENLTRGRR